MPIGSNTTPPMANASTAPIGPPRSSQSSMTTSQPTPTMVPKPREKKSASRSLRASEIMSARVYASGREGRSARASSFQVRQHLFELRRSRRVQQLVDHHLGGRDDGSGGTHAVDADVPVPAHAGADGIGGDMHEVAVVQRAEHSLHHADVGFHAANQQRVAIARHRL